MRTSKHKRFLLRRACHAFEAATRPPGFLLRISGSAVGARFMSMGGSRAWTSHTASHGTSMRDGMVPDPSVITFISGICSVSVIPGRTHSAYLVRQRRIELVEPSRMSGQDDMDRMHLWILDGFHEAAHSVGDARLEAPGLAWLSRAAKWTQRILVAFWMLLVMSTAVATLTGFQVQSPAVWLAFPIMITMGMAVAWVEWTSKRVDEASTEMAGSLFAEESGFLPGIHPGSCSYVSGWLTDFGGHHWRQWALQQAVISTASRLDALRAASGRHDPSVQDQSSGVPD